jgi:hypothetical protein
MLRTSPSLMRMQGVASLPAHERFALWIVVQGLVEEVFERRRNVDAFPAAGRPDMGAVDLRVSRALARTDREEGEN